MGADRIGLRFTAGVAGQRRNAIVDLSGVSFVASLGLRLFISTARAFSTARVPSSCSTPRNWCRTSSTTRRWTR